MLLKDLSDEELMRLYQNGSEDAFKHLYDRHSSKVYGFLKTRVNPLDKVADIYQEVFIKIHKSKHLYNTSLPVLPWIFTITKSVMIDELRKDKKSKLNDDINFDLIPAFDEEPASPKETSLLIDKLPNQQKLALQMRYIDDKTFEEIASSLETTSSNVRQIISRGIKRLKEIVNQEEHS